MKIAVLGSTSFNNYELLKESLSKYSPEVLITGGASGADELVEKYARENGVRILTFHPEWDSWNVNENNLRVEEIIVFSDFLIVFWDGKSEGTKNAIEVAKSKNKEVVIIKF